LKAAKEEEEKKKKKEEESNVNGFRPRRRRGGKPAKPAASEPEAEAADKLVSAILTGVNRAAPFMVGNDAMYVTPLIPMIFLKHCANCLIGWKLISTPSSRSPTQATLTQASKLFF
jgi:ribosome biogenesis protein MAK21